MTRIPTGPCGKLNKTNTCGHSKDQGGGCKYHKQQFEHGTLCLCTCEYSAEFGHYLSPYHPRCWSFEVEATKP